MVSGEDDPNEKERAYKTWTELSYQGDDEPLQLTTISTDLMRTERREATLRVEADARTNSATETVIMDWEMVRNEIKRGVILGDPGSGKSWLLKYEGRELAREQLKKLQQGQLHEEEVVFPIFLRLGTFAEEIARSNTHILELIVYLVRQEYTFSEHFLLYLKHWLADAQCVLLLDGLDEVAEDRRTHLQEALKQLADTSNCSILLTSRLIGYRGVPFVQHRNRWKQELELVTFTQQQIEGFIGNWFAKRIAFGVHLSSILRNEPHLRLLAGIPLLLSFLCLATALSETIPTRRADLYERVLRLLLEASWRNTRSYIQEKSFQESLEEKSALLEYLAWHFATLNGRWHDLMLEEELQEVVKIRCQEQHSSSALFSPEYVLKELTEKDAILVKVGSSQRIKQKGKTPYLFLHRTFHEFLIARYLAAQPVEIYLALIQPHLWFDADWEVVILLFAGYVDDPNPLLKTLLYEPQDAFHSMLLLAGRCLSEARKSAVKKELKDTIVGRLFAVLHSPSKEDRSRAVAVLGKLGEMALDQAISIVQSKKYSLVPALEDVRVAVVEILGQLNHPRATQALVSIFQKSLNNKNPESNRVFSATVVALGKMNNQQSTELLIKSIEVYSAVRSSIIPGLKYLNNPLAIEMIRDLLLKEEASSSRRGILNALKMMDHDKVSEILLDILCENYRSYKWVASLRKFMALHATLICDLEARKSFVSALRSGSLIHLGLEERGNPEIDAWLEAVPYRGEELSQLWGADWETSQPDEAVASSFFTTLRDFPAECQELLRLREILAWVIAQFNDSEKVHIYLAKIQALGKSYSQGYLDYVTERSKAYQEKLKAEGLLIALQNMNEVEKKHYNYYTQIWIIIKLNFEIVNSIQVENNSHSLSLLIIDTLGELGGDRVIKALIGLLHIEKNKSWSKFFYTRLVSALGRIGDSRATNVLVEVLQDPDIAEKISPLSVLAALGKTGGEQAVEPLLTLLQRRDHDRFGQEQRSVRSRVARTLGEIGDPQAIEFLRRTLYDPDELVRTESARALGNLGDMQVLNTLLTELSANPLNTIVSDALALLPHKDKLVGSPLQTSTRYYKRRHKFTEQILIAFGKQEDPKVVKILLGALRQQKDLKHMRHIEEKIFGRFARKRDITLLIHTLMDKKTSTWLKIDIIHVLSNTDDTKALEAILICLQDHFLYYTSKRALESLATQCDVGIFCKHVLNADQRLDLDQNARLFLYELLLRQAPQLRDEAGKHWGYWQKRLTQPMTYIIQQGERYISNESWSNKLLNTYTHIAEVWDKLSRYQVAENQRTSSSQQESALQIVPAANSVRPLKTILALFGITERTIAWLSYMGGGGTGLFFLLWWWKNRFIRFHAICSILFFTLVYILFSILHYFTTFILLNIASSLFSFTIWIRLMFLAREGRYPTLSVIAKWVKKLRQHPGLSNSSKRNSAQ